MTCADYFVNGKLNTFIELIRDSDDVVGHFDRFVKTGGAYFAQKKRFAVLDIVTNGNTPFKLPQSYEKYEDQFYTFIVTENELNKGSLVVTTVCLNICAPARDMM